MKRSLFFAIVLLLVVGNIDYMKAQSRNDRNRAAREKRYESQKPEKTRELPCMMYDDDEWYVASGASRIKMGGDNGGLSTAAINKLLGECQQQLKMKLKGPYKAVIRDYFDQMDLDAQSTVALHIESAGEMVINQMLDDTMVDCQELGEVDDAGYAMLYMGIQIRKSDIVEGLVNGMQKSEGLSQEEKSLVRQNESALRESTFKEFDKDKETNLQVVG
jgi:hypothetical protein